MSDKIPYIEDVHGKKKFTEWRLKKIVAHKWKPSQSHILDYAVLGLTNQIQYFDNYIALLNGDISLYTYRRLQDTLIKASFTDRKKEDKKKRK